jgi:hypothetical protein
MNVETVISELEDRVKIDQEMRTRTEKVPFDEWVATDTESASLVKKIIAEHGPVTIEKFGKKASNNAWLLVQHADHDLPFQKEYLNLMVQNSNSFNASDIAYLTDRVKVNSNEPQIYGTQFYFENGFNKPRPTIDPKNVNERRAKMGMGTIQEYSSYWNKVDLSDFE